MYRMMLIIALAKCDGQSFPGYNYVNGATQFGDILKPPPPPLPIAPVPFHGGKPQRQNLDLSHHYNYQTASTTSILPGTASTDFKFPAPFYKQYNFNFVPAPQPFSTTPSPSVFQKISGWLFPSAPSRQQNTKIEPFQKDCNPCNLVPWIPVIKYNSGEKNQEQSQNPTYGPPSPTALVPNLLQYNTQQSILNQVQQAKQISQNNHGGIEQNSQKVFENPISTYGPPSATHQTSYATNNPQSSTFISSSSSNGFFDLPIAQPGPSYGLPAPSYTAQTSSYQSPYVTPIASFDISSQTTTASNILTHNPENLRYHSPTQTEAFNLNVVTPAVSLQLPKATYPTGFKNSYGEDITISQSIDTPYSLTSLRAESSKIKNQVIPQSAVKPYQPNVSVALARPAPFSLNKGRNIHTLQPVALPNLSVSPLPPIFNARPFRLPTSQSYQPDLIHGINYMKKNSNNVQVKQSVPIADFVHSIEYPTTIIQSPVIDIDTTKTANHNKAYRNIVNSYTTDEIHDISPQASEDHISAAKANQDISFESTGADYGNNLYELTIPTDVRNDPQVPSNHKPDFADLRGVKDEDIDRYRTENNLQSIDSPLLYLKPSAPHKNFENFVIALSTSETQREYEIYDEFTTTPSPFISTTATASWDERKTYDADSSSSEGRENRPKVVQIIVPYIKEQKQKGKNKELRSVSQETHLGRKVPFNTEVTNFVNDTETSLVSSTTTEYLSTVTEQYEAELINTPTSTSDMNDLREPPFDIIKLQHTIDDWTEQEYSNHFSTPDRTRNNEKYAKQIPDEYFTTLNPYNQQTTEANYYNYDDFDHEGSSSVQHSVTDMKNGSFPNTIKEYNVLDISKNKHLTEKGPVDKDEDQKLRIYTAASSFRSTTTTPAPWGSIQTSISPLTKEKVYVVTSKPWRDKTDTTTEIEYALEKFESKKTDSIKDDEISTDDFLFNSPRFASRPPFGFTSSGPVSLDSIKSDSSYGFSKGWHQSINNLRSLYQSDGKLISEGLDEKIN